MMKSNDSTGKHPATFKYPGIEAYHAAFPPQTRAKLDTLRKTIQQIVPQAGEIISYNIPTFKLNKNLVHYAAYQRHIGFYPTSAPLSVFATALRDYTTSKGAVQFPLDKPLPLALIKQIVKYRVTADAKKGPGKRITEYDPVAKARAAGSVYKGLRHGHWEWFRTDGTLLRSGSYFNGHPIGEWITYDKSGKVSSRRFRK